MGKLQYKLVQILLLTSTLPLIVVAAITVIFLQSIAINEVEQSINHNLNIAQTIYQNVNENLKYVVRDENRKAYTLLENNQRDLLRAELKEVAERNNLDFFIITDTEGKVIVSTNKPELEEGDDLSNDYAVQKAIAMGAISVSTEVFPEEELKKLGLQKRAIIPGAKTTEGLVIRVVLPVINREEQVIAAMSAGYLLNNNERIIVDEIKKATGLVSSIFLGDLRICSNIPSQGSEYAVGGMLQDSATVIQILKRGQDYIGSKIVLGRRYIVGYTPIYNGQKDVIGCLSIGIPEASIFSLRNNLIKIFALAVLLSIVLALIFGLSKGGNIVKSINKLRFGTEAVSKGDFKHQIKIDSQDEIEELSDFFNRMTSQLKIAREQVEEYSKGLENKVKERTEQLESAHKQLVEYERMAAMGRMATAISHELRNVFAGIQTVAYYLKRSAVKECPRLSNSVQDIEEEINYANSILNNILRFSRPQKLILGDVDINSIVENVLASLSLQEEFKNNKIEFAKELDLGLPKVKADGVQIKEVTLNLVINAVQAMRNGGRLTIATKKDGEYLKLEVKDTGCGIPEDILKTLFTPFRTTKSKGLGLGLSICKEIINAHRGKIEVLTELNKGSTFIVSLPLGGS